MRSSAFCLLVIAVTAAGCGAPDDAPAVPDQLMSVGEGPDFDLLRNTVSYSYHPYETPNDMLEAADVVISGEIVSVDTALIADDLESAGAVIVGVRPSEEVKRTFGDPGDVVHYWIDRPKNLDAAVYQEALPLGTRVVLFGMETKTSSDTRFVTPVPSTVFTPDPQGLFLAAPGDELVSVWAGGTGRWPESQSPQELLDEAVLEEE